MRKCIKPTHTQIFSKCVIITAFILSLFLNLQVLASEEVDKPSIPGKTSLNIQNIPNDVWGVIFSFLIEPKDKLALGETCKHLNGISKNPKTWQNFTAHKPKLVRRRSSLKDKFRRKKNRSALSTSLPPLASIALSNAKGQELEGFSDLPNLKHLQILETKLDKTILKTLATLKQLESLDLSGCTFPEKKGLGFIEHLPNLEELNVTNIHVGKKSPRQQDIEQITKAPKITRLYISQNSLGEAIELIINRMHNLTVLIAGNNKITPEHLKNLGSLNNLIKLGLPYNNSIDISSLASHLPPSLMELDAEGIKLDFQGIRLLRKYDSLTTLHIGNFFLRSEDKRRILEENRKLRILIK